MCHSEKAIIIVPCYNEEKRLELQLFDFFTKEHTSIFFLFVDDGSTDHTGKIVKNAQSDHIHLLSLKKNFGKSEAIRQGYLLALKQNPKYIGYWDADLSTPLSMLLPLLNEFSLRPELQLVMGARINRLGADIRRKTFRHFVSKAFIMFINLLLPFSVYDSQCGAKIMTSETAQTTMTEPFYTRWLFDLEILCRLYFKEKKSFSRKVLEYPLFIWIEQSNSNVHFIRVGIDIFRFIIFLFSEKRKSSTIQQQEK